MKKLTQTNVALFTDAYVKYTELEMRFSDAFQILVDAGHKLCESLWPAIFKLSTDGQSYAHGKTPEQHKAMLASIPVKDRLRFRNDLARIVFNSIEGRSEGTIQNDISKVLKRLGIPAQVGRGRQVRKSNSDYYEAAKTALAKAQEEKRAMKIMVAGNTLELGKTPKEICASLRKLANMFDKNGRITKELPAQAAA